MPKRLKFFVCCGSSPKSPPQYLHAAKELGRLMAQNQYEIIYGGGDRGLMEALASSALINGGKVVGIVPKFLKNQEGTCHPRLTELHFTETLKEAKQGMMKEADVFVILPGGVGTLDEFFEIVAEHRLGLHSKPLFVLNFQKYWNPLKELLQSTVDAGFASEEQISYIQFVDTPENLIHLIKGYFSYGQS